ncbi:hypothetical protein [Pseudoxanthomonas mexicana]|uniref:hypothetical protein n=1 Tax=Pseudoxanthomonas mexicana TaxID=128785 RepID=UPI002896D682|nr:hypothetical protein [Pseudoxanthomonas mexicana]
MGSRADPSGVAEDLASLAVVRRMELAQHYLSGEATQALLGIDASTLTAWCKERRLFAVWHKPEKQWIYPDFQFDRAGLIEQMPALLAVYERYYSQVWNNTWGIVEWFMAPHLLLDGALPMEMISSDPQLVLRIARIEFLQNPATMW